MSEKMPVTESHVCLPLAMAHRLFDCYYGGGPRHQEREARPGVVALGDGQVGQGPAVSDEGGLGDALSLERMRPATMRRGFVPRGVAPGAKPNPPPVGV